MVLFLIFIWGTEAKWHDQWVAEELELSSSTHTISLVFYMVLLLLHEFSYQENDIFLIFCTSGAELGTCYGPYVEKYLSTVSQMVLNSRQRSHLETFRGSSHSENIQSNADRDAVIYSKLTVRNTMWDIMHKHANFENQVI